MSDDFEVLRGTGNVFADLGDANADAKQLKAQLAAEITGTFNRRGLSVRQAAELARVAFCLGRKVRVEFVPVQPEAAA